jgi:hypothetical protein
MLSILAISQLSVDGSLGPSVSLFGHDDKPIDLVVHAIHTLDGTSSLELSFLMFGRTMDDHSISETHDPIEYESHLQHSFPSGGDSDLSAIVIFRIRDRHLPHR